MEIFKRRGSMPGVFPDYKAPIIRNGADWIAEDWLPRVRAAGLKAAASTASMTFFGRASIGAIQARLGREIMIQNFRSIHAARTGLKTIVS